MSNGVERRVFGSVLAMVVGATVLVGCAPSQEVVPTTEPIPTATAEPTPEPTVPVQTEFFAMPDDCTAMLPAKRLAAFEADGVILLAGPGGKYGNELITEPTPEMDAGGISCYFGIDNEDPTLLEVRVLVSAVPLDDTSRSETIAYLTELGLLEGTDERGNVTFGILGTNSGQTTASHNVIAPDSWISVISAKRGEKAYLAAVDIANDVHIATYN